MNPRGIAQGIKLYKRNKKTSFLVLIESILLSAIIGFWLESFAITAITFLALFALTRIRIFAWIITIGISVVWGFIGFIIGLTFSVIPIFALYILGLILGVVFFIISYRVHAASFWI